MIVEILIEGDVYVRVCPEGSCPEFGPSEEDIILKVKNLDTIKTLKDRIHAKWGCEGPQFWYLSFLEYSSYVKCMWIKLPKQYKPLVLHAHFREDRSH